MQPLITVIVPVFKVEEYLDKCVGSLVEQTYQNLEIILVDDGSPDNCPAMCDAWAKKDSRIRVIHKENGGLSDARNAGMAAASGQFIGFVDSDDWIAPEMYERLLQALKKDGSDIAACSVEMVWEDNSPSRMLTKRINCVLDRYEAQAELLTEDKLKQPVWYKLYRRSVIDGILFEKGKYHEDVFWSYRAIGNANQVSLIDYVGYYYRQRTTSIMGENYSIRRLDALEGICQRYTYMKEHFPQLEKKALCSIWNDCIYQGQMAQKYLSGQERKTVFQQLYEVRNRYPLKNRDTVDEKTTHRIWFALSKISLPLTCKIRNVLHVGT